MSQNFFSVLVVGDNPQQLLEKYNSNNKVEYYIKYKQSEAEMIQTNEKKVLHGLIKSKKLSASDELSARQRLREIEKLNPLDYFDLLSYNEEIDDEGNILTNENPLGKFEWCEIGKRFSVPFSLLDSTTSYQAKKIDVNWDLMHRNNISTYETVWELIIEGKIPSNETEEILYKNMQNLDNYFKKFQNKDEYVKYNTSFFHYAYLDENGWLDMDDSSSDKGWVTTYYEKFIEPLDNDVLLSVFECKKK